MLIRRVQLLLLQRKSSFPVYLKSSLFQYSTNSLPEKPSNEPGREEDEFKRYNGMSPAEYLRVHRLGQVAEEYFKDNEHMGFNADGTKREYQPWWEVIKSYKILWLALFILGQDEVLRDLNGGVHPLTEYLGKFMGKEEFWTKRRIEYLYKDVIHGQTSGFVSTRKPHWFKNEATIYTSTPLTDDWQEDDLHIDLNTVPTIAKRSEIPATPWERYNSRDRRINRRMNARAAHVRYSSPVFQNESKP